MSGLNVKVFCQSIVCKGAALNRTEWVQLGIQMSCCTEAAQLHCFVIEALSFMASNIQNTLMKSGFSPDLTLRDYNLTKKTFIS